MNELNIVEDMVEYLKQELEETDEYYKQELENTKDYYEDIIFKKDQLIEELRQTIRELRR